MIVNNGMGRFGRAATLAIISSAIRAAAAVAFVAMPAGGLAGWSWLYLAANAVSLLVAVLFYYPRQKLILKTGIYFKRLPDALYVAGAEVLFYLQWNSTSCWCWRSAAPSLPASTPSSCGWST